jgi:cytochrome c biogenesis protein
MNPSTAGINLRTQQRWLAESVELLSSMRFAISLLTVISIASIVGTVLQQSQPMTNYVNQFGPFWFEVFAKLSLYSVYSAWWFILIMGFLVLSTTLCIVRNTPKMLKDMRSWRENVREQSLRNFHHHAEWQSTYTPPALAHGLAQRIAGAGYKAKVVEKDGATLIAAKQGAASKWGYIFAHSAIVIICLGGLMDSDLAVRAQQVLFGKTPFMGTGLISEIPQQHRLGTGNPTFRGVTEVPEGASSNTALLFQQEGVLVQDLPFSIKLERFIIDYYSTGMPKLFASEVIVTDHVSGERFPATIKVNEPLIHKGIAVYQSSFDDGGSQLKLTAYPMKGANTRTFAIDGKVKDSTLLKGVAEGQYTVEWTGFRPFNVENMATEGQDVRAVNANQSFSGGLLGNVNKHLGSAAKGKDSEEFKNVGPSVQYKLRDQTGQAKEYHNYMRPVEVDGQWVYLTGMRETPDEPFRYLRIPADDNDGVDEWMRLRAALMDPVLRERAAQRYAAEAIAEAREGTAPLRQQLRESAVRGLGIFAGTETQGGYIGVSRFLERLPSTDQEKAADIFMKILHGSMWELWQVAREQQGLPAMESNEKNSRFLQVAINAVSDSFLYGAPVYLQLQEFEEVKSSVFQVTRSPGKNVVYFGCLLLTLGIFAMFYIRDRRLWVWIRRDEEGKAHALMAMSTPRRTLDFDKEFEVMKEQLTKQ